MRTTKKEFREIIWDHIFNNIVLEDEEKSIIDKAPISFQEHYKLEKVLVHFHNEFWDGLRDSYKKSYGKQYAMKEWLLGLPSVVSFHYTDYDIEKELKEWFEQLGEKYKPSKRQDPIDVYYHLIIREMFYLFKKYNVMEGYY